MGTHFAVCGMATRGLAGTIATDMLQDAEAVYKELMGNTIPNSHVVSAGVLAVNYLSAEQIPTTDGEWLALMQHFGTPTPASLA